MICPFKYKYELVHFFVKYQGWTVTEANSKTKKQLYAIYYKKYANK